MRARISAGVYGDLFEFDLADQEIIAAALVCAIDPRGQFAPGDRFDRDRACRLLAVFAPARCIAAGHHHPAGEPCHLTKGGAP